MRTIKINRRHYTPTLGMTGTDGKQIVGLFSGESDARNIDADALAIGSVSADSLTPEQFQIAHDNAAELDN